MRRRGVSAGTLDVPSADPGGPSDAPTQPLPTPPAPVRLQTEFTFHLPRGYVDEDGTVHREGTMRLATARDELAPLVDLRVKQNPAYLSIVLLSLVVTRLGTITQVRAEVVERLFASDLAFLQDLYRRINAEGHTLAEVTCPSCETVFEVDLAGGVPGES
ncbi:hypothetical protein ABT336_14230 [Micromonospora sp. NPDC000207]|uniref:hypothetical protein n=1 Tax=Micromonospora sp. NPDC000207 TaxID=3154246 RepID=UPI00331848C3